MKGNDFLPCCDSVDGGTSASRSAGTPRQGNDSSKIHPPREGPTQSRCKSEQRLSSEVPSKVIKMYKVITKLCSRRSFSQEQPGGFDSRDPRREGQRELHHLPAAPSQRLGHAHPLLQQHGRPGGERRLLSLTCFKHMILHLVY